MSDWLKRKKENFPEGSLEKFLKFDCSKDVLEAFRKRHRPKASNIETLSDEELALALTGRLVNCMFSLGVRHAKREDDRE